MSETKNIGIDNEDNQLAKAASSFSLPSFPLRLSQTQLGLLSTCPRKFQHVYLEQLTAPTDFEQQERQSQGSQFHLLMQQWHLGLPIEPIVQDDPQLQRWFNYFMTASPKILALESFHPTTQQSEHSRTLEFDGYLLTVVYDLLISNQQQAKILDWKTYPRPKNPQWLLQNWQTRLYPFVLAETSSYQPEQISMVYWFFQSERDATAEPQSLTIAYDRAKHEQTHKDLTAVLAQLTYWLEAYQTGVSFPQVASGSGECETCSFTVRCDRSTSSSESHWSQQTEQGQESRSNKAPLTLPNLSDIQEVPL